MAQLVDKIPEHGLTEFLDGVIATLCNAPWTRPGDFLNFSYFADPARRLEFLAAADELLPKIRSLKKLATEVEQHHVLKQEAEKAKAKVREEWRKARGWEPFPPSLGTLVKEILDRLPVVDPDGSATAAT